MKKVELYDLSGAALIIPMKTGVLFTNQVSGTACLHPEIEGLLVPFNNDHLTENYNQTIEYQLMELFINNGWGNLVEEQAIEINKLLLKYPETNSASVNMAKLNESYESWVWCNIKESKFSGISGFSNIEAVLTWQNSD